MTTNPAALLCSVASVVTCRLRMLSMMIVSPTPKRQREAVRMATEKIEAACEGALAIHIAILKQAQSFWLGGWKGGVTVKGMAGAGKRILAAGGAPAIRRLEANRRRLGV